MWLSIFLKSISNLLTFTKDSFCYLYIIFCLSCHSFLVFPSRLRVSIPVKVCYSCCLTCMHENCPFVHGVRHTKLSVREGCDVIISTFFLLQYQKDKGRERENFHSGFTQKNNQYNILVLIRCYSDKKI